MPILPPEPYISPEDLLTATARELPAGGQWWVLHTRPRAEKAIARKFLHGGVPFFLPVNRKQTRIRGRVVPVCEPLFPGYLFVVGDAHIRAEALATNQVANVLAVSDQALMHQELARIAHVMEAGLMLVPEEGLRPGDLVVIEEGPLAGLEGKVLKQGGNFRFFIEVSFLQRGVSVEIEGWMIRPRQPAESSFALGY
jgi:transcriptional antiterminator RfaH